MANTASGLLAINFLDVLPSSPVSVEGSEVDLGEMVQNGIVDEEGASIWHLETAHVFQREPVGRT